MISIDNYFVEISKVIIANLPETLKKGHQFLEKATDNGTSWDDYYGNETIRKVIDLYLNKLNQHLASVRTEPKPSIHVRKPRDKKQLMPERKEVTKRTLQKPKRSREKKDTKKVEHIREEVKFIRRFVALHNKEKSSSSILSFIKSLQRSIVQKLIRKTSPLAREIEEIQDKLVNAYNKAKGDLRITIDSKDLPRLVSIAGGEEVYPSINIIKRYISLQGKEVDNRKIELYNKQIENALNKKRVRNDDPYYDRVKAIHNTIKKLKAGNTVRIGQAELSGLEGIVKECQCKSSLGRIYNTGGKRLRPCKQKTYTDSKNKGACSHNSGLTGVLTAEEMANRELDLLHFFGSWLLLFGKPARNFALMLHGGPHNGKTILLLKFAQFLAENFGNVLYVSSEEFASPTMTAKVNQFVNPKPPSLHFAENLSDPNLYEYDFIILDSVNDLGLKINEYKELRKAHPEAAFIFILQHTKAGEFKGAKDWEHIAEIVGEVHEGTIAVTKNRYAPKSELDFFDHFGIEWRGQETAQPNLFSKLNN